jgi:stage V sporulation protein AB
MAAAGVFTVLIAVGLVPRFAGKTHTASYILFYEDCVVLGTITGTLFSVFEQLHPYTCRLFTGWYPVAGGITGFFMGCFVGCLALSIAEMLDSIPIFARRVRLRRGIGIAVFAAALGKLSGALLYFLQGIE